MDIIYYSCVIQVLYLILFVIDKLKILWQQKLTDYNKEEEELKKMLTEAEAKKHEKREIEIQEKFAEWDHILFGPNFRCHEMVFDNHTFLEIRYY